MEQRTLEITIISAKDLNKVNLITKMDVYAVVFISGDSNSKQKFKTPVDKDGGNNPTWNFTVKFTIDEAAAQQNGLSLVLKLKSERVLGDKEIGEVRVPIKELLDSPGSVNGKQFVSYQIRKPDGKPKGFISFSYQFGEKAVKVDEPVAKPPPTNMVVRVPIRYGYPPQQGDGRYPPQQPGYGHGYPPQQGYGYPPVVQPQKKKNKMGMGLGAGLLGGALGGMLLGDMVSDVGAYDAGYDAGFDDAGFDF
ncbi:hypothetical protein Leryth_016448 [Lithospermum erythrorhizon]|nr:hypothetical protein Leryth_016448 [Lithospermum erythrorhizon]